MQMGKTKLFLRAEQMAELDAKKARLLRNSATVIQRHFRTYTTRKDYIVLRKSSIHIQSHWRGESISYHVVCFLDVDMYPNFLADVLYRI